MLCHVRRVVQDSSVFVEDEKALMMEEWMDVEEVALQVIISTLDRMTMSTFVFFIAN